MTDYIIPVLTLLAAWGSGFAVCRFTHRDKGIEVDPMNIVFTPPPTGWHPVTNYDEGLPPYGDGTNKPVGHTAVKFDDHWTYHSGL